jgi:hypothetical protein
MVQEQSFETCFGFARKFATFENVKNSHVVPCFGVVVFVSVKKSRLGVYVCQRETAARPVAECPVVGVMNDKPSNRHFRRSVPG